MFSMLEQRVIAPVLESGSVVVVLGAVAQVEAEPWH